MWTKITNAEQLQGITTSTGIIKYPIDGEPLNNYDGANKDNVALRIVQKNDMGEIDFIIPNLGKPFPIHKKYDQFIAEGIWWINI